MNHNSTRLRYIAASCLLLAAAAAPTALHAVPAYPGVIQFEQPDGSIVPILLRGDERGRRAMTTDGYMLLENADGYLTYATVDTQGFPAASGVRATAPELRSAADVKFLSTLRQPIVTQAFDAAARMNAIAREGGENQRYLCSGAAFPASGEPRALVVLVEFTDKHFSMQNPGEFYTRMLNEEGFADYGATGSARDFFIDNSNGLFKPQFDVYGPVQLANNMRYYGGNDMAGYDLAPEQAVIEGCTQLDEQGVDFSVYDTNDDGQIDNVFVFYAGYGEADSNRTETIWPHSADIDSFELRDDDGNLKKWYFDGKQLNRYGMTNEVDFSFRRPDGIGTFVHEFSHVMGLPDLYATEYTLAFTPGSYSTLDMGPYNNAGRTPPYYGVFERYCLDWLDPEVIEATGDYELEAIHTSNKAYIIPTDKPDEFFLLENRQQEGSDAYIPGHGMLVWHVDYVPTIWNKNIINNTASHQYVDIVEADNKREEANRDGDPFPGTQNVMQLSDRTRPELRAWSGEQVGVALSDIREDEGKILFTAKVASTGIGAVEESSAAALAVEGDRLVNRSADTAIVYDLAGAKVAEVAPGGSATLAKGIYVVATATDRLKICL